MSMSVLGTVHVMVMQTVLIVMVVTGVSVCQDSREMDTTVEVIVQRKIHSSVE